jgi:hypothetical protein
MNARQRESGDSAIVTHRDLVGEVIEELTLTALNNAAVHALRQLADHRGMVVTVAVAGSDPELVAAATVVIDASIAVMPLELPSATLLRRAVDNDELVDLVIYVMDQPRARDIVMLGQRPPAPHRPVDPLRTLILRSATSDTLRHQRVIDPTVARYGRDDIDVSLRACAAAINGSIGGSVLGAIGNLDHQTPRCATDFLTQADLKYPDIAWRTLLEQVGVEELRALGTTLGALAAPPTPAQLGWLTGHQQLTEQLHVILHEGASLVDLTVASQLEVMLATNPTDWPAPVIDQAARTLVSMYCMHCAVSPTCPMTIDVPSLPVSSSRCYLINRPTVRKATRRGATSSPLR